MSSKEMQWLLQEKYQGEKTEAFFADCRRLALGEPLAYIIGWTPFLKAHIWLDAKPLIPRTETEFWTEEAISVITQTTQNGLGIVESSPKILDLCAGSGCIGVAVAMAVDTARVDFAEIDVQLLPTIEKNLIKNGVPASRTSIFHSNLFAKVPTTYDFILTNPPYIDETQNRVEDSVTQYEPRVALYGGAGGLDVITEIIRTAPKHLSRGGQLWIEHEPEQVAALHALATQHGFSATTHTDQYQVERYSILVLQ